MVWIKKNDGANENNECDGVNEKKIMVLMKSECDGVNKRKECE